MSEKVYIQDDFGTKIPLLDNYGNLSLQVIMLYAEDKLTEADRKTVDDFAATDEMSRDALDGFAMTTNASKTRHYLSELNTQIQKKTGAAAVAATISEKPKFDYRKMAAAIALLVVIGAGTFFVAEYFRRPQLADGTAAEKEDVAATRNEQTVSPQEEPALMDEAFAEHDSEETAAMEDVDLPKDRAQQKIMAQDAGNTPKPKEAQATTPVPVAKALEDAEKAAVAKREEVKPTQIEQQLAQNALRPEPTGNSGRADSITMLAANQKMDESADVAAGMAAIDKATNELAKEESKRKESELAASKEAEKARKAEEKEAKQLAREEQAAETRLAQLETQRAAAESAARANMEMERKAEETKDRSQSAKYPGGDMAMYKFIDKKKIYTEAMKAQNLSGAVSITFDIEPDGRVTNAKVKSGVNGPLNEDALRVVRSMPKWNPAKDASGENIRSSRTVVIKYGED